MAAIPDVGTMFTVSGARYELVAIDKQNATITITLEGAKATEGFASIAGRIEDDKAVRPMAAAHVDPTDTEGQKPKSKASR